MLMFSNSLKYDSFCCMLSARSTSSDCKERKQKTTVNTIWHDSLILVQFKCLQWSNLHIFVNMSSYLQELKKEKSAVSMRLKMPQKEQTSAECLLAILYSDKLLFMLCCYELDSVQYFIYCDSSGCYCCCSQTISQF